MGESTGAVLPRGASLVIESGFYAGLEWTLERTATVIGRGRDADLVLSEATISRAHALVGFEAGRLFVQDLGSTNGTLVNGTRSARSGLSHGDQLQLGKLVIAISWPDAAPDGGARDESTVGGTR
jgi:predicted component of type VI protein secretion system